MKVIILAGGRGTRLQHSAKDIPKALVPIDGKPILQHQIDLFEKHGFSDIRLALGFRAEQIIAYLNGKYEYVVEPEPLGTGGALKFASRDLAEPFIAVNGDVISNVNFSKLFATIDKSKNHIVVAYHKKNTDFGMIEIDKHGAIVKFQEKPAAPTDGYVNVGVYVLHPNTLASIPKKQFSLEYDLFPKLADARKLIGFEHDGFWLDVGTPDRYKEAVNIFS